MRLVVPRRRLRPGSAPCEEPHARAEVGPLREAVDARRLPEAARPAGVTVNPRSVSSPSPCTQGEPEGVPPAGPAGLKNPPRSPLREGGSFRRNAPPVLSEPGASATGHIHPSL